MTSLQHTTQPAAPTGMQAPVDVEAYVAQAKRQLDAFAAQWHRQCQIAPALYRPQQTEDQWRRQELAARFGQIEQIP